MSSKDHIIPLGLYNGIQHKKLPIIRKTISKVERFWHKTYPWLWEFRFSQQNNRTKVTLFTQKYVFFAYCFPFTPFPSFLPNFGGHYGKYKINAIFSIKSIFAKFTWRTSRKRLFLVTYQKICSKSSIRSTLMTKFFFVNKKSSHYD